MKSAKLSARCFQKKAGISPCQNTAMLSACSIKSHGDSVRSQFFTVEWSARRKNWPIDTQAIVSKSTEGISDEISFVHGCLRKREAYQGEAFWANQTA